MKIVGRSLFVLLVLAVIGLSACNKANGSTAAAAPSDPIVATWKGELQGVIAYFKFNEDKTLQAVQGQAGQFMRIDATWERKGTDTISVIATGGTNPTAQESKVTIEGDKLTIASNGQTFELTRTTEALPESVSIEEAMKAAASAAGTDATATPPADSGK